MFILQVVLCSLLACTETPVNSIDTDPYVQLWNDQPNQFVRKLQPMPVEEKMIVIRAILEEPSSPRTPQLCQFFTDRNKEYCNQLLFRSHLWEYEQIKQNSAVVDHPVRLRPEQEIAMETITSETVQGCRPDNSWCIEEKARLQIQEQNVSSAKRFCQSIVHTQAKEECFFQIAEEATKRLPPSEVPEMMQLCLHAGVYQENCFAHVMEQMAMSYSELYPKYRTGVVNFWSSRDVSFGKRLIDYLDVNYSRKDPSSTLLDMTHRNSAQTYSFLKTQPRRDLSLGEWKERFAQQKKFDAISENAEIQNYWSPLRDTGHPYCLYLSLSYRPCSKDPERDWQLAMVAALAQQNFPLDTVRAQEDDTLRKMLNKVRKHH